MTDLIRLAERVEALAGASFEVDKAILAALGYTWRGMNYWSADNKKLWKGPTNFTESLDAAKTLAPDDWRHGYEQAGIKDENPLVEAWAWPYESSWEPDWQLGYDCYRGHEQGVRAIGTTPARALTAASLRSIAALRRKA